MSLGAHVRKAPRWLPLVLLLLACLALGLYPVDRGLAGAVQQGDRALGERRYSDALGAYALAARRCPGCPQPHLHQGAVYVAQGRYSEAQAAYLAAIRLGGLTPAAMNGLAALYVAEGSEGLAVEALQRLVARRPGRGDLWARLGQLRQAQGEATAARAALERALALDLTEGTRQVVHDRLGILCLGVPRDLPCALEHLSAVESGPDEALAEGASRLVQALHPLVEKGPRDEGGAEVDPAVAHARLGEALYHYGELELARRELEEAVALAPGYADAHAYLGHVLSLLGEGDGAIKHLEQAIALDPDYVLPRYLLGMHHVRRGWWVTGRSVLEQAHEVDPQDPAICAAVADAYLHSPTLALSVAEVWFQAAVDRAPDDARFHLLLAQFYVERAIDPGRRGWAAAQVAVDLAPENSKAHETLGWAYYLGGAPGRALEPLTRALELAQGPGQGVARSFFEARIHYRLGEVYRALGQSEWARAHLNAAIDLDWNGPIGQRARQAQVGGTPVE